MYYGWKIVAVASLAHSISVGFIFYSYGVFLKALTLEFGSSRFGISSGLAIMNITVAIIAPFLGRALTHSSIRNIMCCGALFMAAGFFLQSQITGIWQFYAILALVLGPGVAMMGGLPASTLVVNWFKTRRGTALGISTMGVSMSGVIMAPVATKLIGTIGWRWTFGLYGAVILAVVLPSVWFFVVNRPEDMNAEPNGEPPPGDDPSVALDAKPAEAPQEISEVSPDDVIWTTKRALLDSRFWAIGLIFSFNSFAMGATLTHLIPHATDMGVDPVDAAFLISVAAGVAVVGKLVFGIIADRMDTRIAIWISIGFQAAGVFQILNATTVGMLAIGGGIFGFGLGGNIPLMRMLMGDTFGARSFSRISGLMNPFMLPLRAAGVPFAGLVYDRTGSYTIAFQTFLVSYGVAACLVFLLKPVKLHHAPISPAPELEDSGL